MAKFVLALFLILPSLLQAASLEETEMASHLTNEANEFLDGLVGPGRYKVVVTVSAEKSVTTTQSEVLTPIPKQAKAGEEPASLPGYAPKNTEKPIDYVQRDQEQTVRTSGLIIKNIQVSVVLDAALNEAQANAVRRVLPDLLHMQTDRGDVLNVQRAEMTPPWKAALRTNQGLLIVVLLGLGVGLIVFICLVIFVTATRVTRILVSELAAARKAQPSPLPQGGGYPGLPGAGLPELMPGGIPGLTDEEAPGAPGGALPAPGKRFDFFAAKDPAEVADLLAQETPEELALLFAYLTESNPDLASHIFSAFPPNYQASISVALVHLRMADPEKLAMLENRIKTELEFGIRGPERLSRILSRLPPEEREGLLMGISAQNSEDAQAVEKFLLVFEDLANLKPGDLRRLLIAVPYQQWGLSLRGANQAMIDRILAELPPGTRQIVREAMESPQPKDKVMDARLKVLAVAQGLAAKGQIALGREGASSEMM